MKELIEFFAKGDQFARHIGCELTEVSPGHSKVQLDIKPHHINSVGIVQGGVIFTMADYAFAAASNSHGTVAVALNVNISFIKPAKSGRLFAVADEVSLGRTTGNYTARVTDETGKLIALFQGIAYRKQERIEL